MCGRVSWTLDSGLSGLAAAILDAFHDFRANLPIKRPSWRVMDWWAKQLKKSSVK